MTGRVKEINLSIAESSQKFTILRPINILKKESMISLKHFAFSFSNLACPDMAAVLSPVMSVYIQSFDELVLHQAYI